MTNQIEKDIEQVFQKHDKDGDGFVSREELVEMALELQVELSPQESSSYANAVDLERTGRVSRAEFAFLMQFKKSSLQGLPEVLYVASESFSLVKMLVHTQNIDAIDSETKSYSSIALSVKDANVGPPEQLPTLIELLVGDFNNHKELKRVLSSQTTYESGLVINFKVVDKKLIMQNMPEYFEAMRAILSELGPEVKAAVESVQFEFRETEEGVQLAVDLSQNSLFAAYAQVIKGEVQQFANLPMELTARVGTDFDLSQYKTSSEQLLSHRYLVEVFSQVFNLSALLGVYRAKNDIKEFIDLKDFHAASFIIGMLSVRNVNLEIELDDKIRAKLKSEFNFGASNEILNETLEKVKLLMESLGVKDFLDALDFFKAALRDLKQAGITELGIFVKAFSAHIGANLRGHVYDILNFLLELDE